jgi:UDPglucose 6-dehydrogenase
MHIGIVGAGYVGLVTAACLAHLGHRITCVDVDGARITGLRAGRSPVHEPGLEALIVEGLGSGMLAFTVDVGSLGACDLVIVCVGTLDAAEEWAGEIVRETVHALAADQGLPRRIVIRSTLLPGTAARLAVELRTIDPSVRLAHNPEFTREAAAVADFLSPDRVVIGVDGHDDGAEGSALVAALREVYEPLDAPVVVTDLTSAETIKVASNVFLAAKITFANELARLAAAAGADASAVVDGMGLDRRIGRAFLSPGPGFGGSCFPSQARALPQLARTLGVETPLMDAIWPSNASQAEWLVEGLEQALGRTIGGLRVALLGLTFKAGTDDLRESPALRIGRALLGRGATVAAYDPVAGPKGAVALAAAMAARGRVEQAPDIASACRAAAAVVVATEWPEFGGLDWAALGSTMAGDVVVDGRSVVDVEAAMKAGLRVIALGVESISPERPSAVRPIALERAG